jgi:hypothetical protein
MTSALWEWKLFPYSYDASLLETTFKAFEGAGSGLIKISYEFEGSVTTLDAFEA